MSLNVRHCKGLHIDEAEINLFSDKFKVLYTFILFLGGCVIFYDQYLNFKVFKMGTFLFLDM